MYFQPAAFASQTVAIEDQTWKDQSRLDQSRIDQSMINQPSVRIDQSPIRHVQTSELDDAVRILVFLFSTNVNII